MRYLWATLLVCVGCQFFLDTLQEDSAITCADSLDNDRDGLLDCSDDECSAFCVCGDGDTDSDEECDDANLLDGDGCSAACLLEIIGCGDGILENSTEACDNGANNSDTTPDACRTNCQLPSCGDGVQDSLEQCDDGNQLNDDGCTTQCVNAVVCNATEFPDGVVFQVEPSTGHCYFVSIAQTDWFAGRAFCLNDSGDLASIANIAENDLVLDISNNNPNLWIGLNDQGSGSNFVWSDGTPTTFTNFRPGGDANPDGNADCVEFDAAGQWGEDLCARLLPFVCEFVPQ